MAFPLFTPQPLERPVSGPPRWLNVACKIFIVFALFASIALWVVA